jgi:glycosyltransferase involved in cell wall biosynthesis
MLFLPNVEGVLWFARCVLPLVAEKVPGVKFTIVGKNPPPAVRALESESGSTAVIQVTGYAADPQPFLESAGVFIIPLLSGGGMRVKILDAWRWGLPVVSTPVGAEGIEVRDGENILIAETAEAFAQSISRVLTDPELNQTLRENGRRWVEEHYHWQKTYTAWDKVYPS